MYKGRFGGWVNPLMIKYRGKAGRSAPETADLEELAELDQAEESWVERLVGWG
jgi:hypothetical protein